MQISSLSDFSFVANMNNSTPSRSEASSTSTISNGFNIGDALTNNDKVLVKWNPSTGKINQTAIALASYRNSGAITGEVSANFVNALSQSISNTGGYPANPSLLLNASIAPSQGLLASSTSSALFSIFNPSGTANSDA